jgi:hypothetical protein
VPRLCATKPRAELSLTPELNRSPSGGGARSIGRRQETTEGADGGGLIMATR